MNAYSDFFPLMPFAPSHGSIGLTAKVAWSEDILNVDYLINDSSSDIALQPPVTEPARCDHLWETTCFELFLAPQGLRSYWEFNFSPSGNWAVYSFADYRQAMTPEVRINNITLNRQTLANGQMLWSFKVDLKAVAELRNAPRMNASLTAVIETKSGQKSYWAITHKSEKPDFHLRESFVCVLNRQS